MLRAGHGLVLIVVALLTLGVVMVSSASLTIDSDRAIDLGTVLLGRPAMLAGLAMVMLWLGSRVPIDRLYPEQGPSRCRGPRPLRPTDIAARPYPSESWPGRAYGALETALARGFRSPIAWIVLVVVALLLAVHLPGIGREINGARRWIDLGFVGFQPSELAKWGVPVVLAGYAARRSATMGRLASGLGWPLLLLLVVCGLVATEDLGTAVLIGAVGMGVLLAGGVKLWQAALVLPAAALGVVAAVLHRPYRLDRLAAFIDPYQDPQGTGYHLLHSLAAVADGGLAGRGLGNGVAKFGYLPQDTSDFIFAVICEELGVVGGAIVIFLHAGLLLCGLAVIRRVTHPFARLLGVGIVLTLGLQTLMNLAVVTGLAPTKGIALPLVSAGGTGWALTAFSIGLLVSMERGIMARAPLQQRSPSSAPPQAMMP